jgi:hypothetical protein
LSNSLVWWPKRKRERKRKRKARDQLSSAQTEEEVNWIIALFVEEF